jgi:hypothetical protein
MILRKTSIARRALAAHALLNIAVMNKLLPLALSLPLVACVVGTEPSTSGDDGTGGGSGSGSGNGAGDHITSNTTWTGTQDVTRPITVDPGVTLTIAPGTTVRLASGTVITVEGIIDVQGTKASPVHLSPATAGDHYSFAIPASGTLKMVYGIQTGGEILVNGGKITATDTRMSQASHDLLVVGAGTVDVSYSSIGIEPGAGTDTTHCDMHFGATGGSLIKVTHSNISTSLYGIMLYGGPGVDLTYDNWFSNQTDIDTLPGAGADISYGWFAEGAPVAGSGATLIYTNPAAGRLADAGPR